MKSALVSIAAITLCTTACSVRHEAQQEEAVAANAPDPRLDSSKIEPIKGNEGHNLLARQGPLERAMALVAVVKQIEGKARCSPERSFYRGRGKTDSFWAVECHDGASFQVQIKRDGSGGTLNCAILDKIDPKNGCWQTLPNR